MTKLYIVHRQGDGYVVRDERGRFAKKPKSAKYVMRDHSGRLRKASDDIVRRLEEPSARKKQESKRGGGDWNDIRRPERRFR